MPNLQPSRTCLLFVDESGRLDQGGLFALGGVALRDRDWPTLRRIWQDALRGAGWPLDREVKWHGIRRGEVPPATADTVFAALAAAPLTGYVTLLDLDAGPEAFPPDEHAFFRSPDDTYATGLMFLAERFHHLLAAEDDVGLIVIDNRFREEDARLRRFFADLTDQGTPYMQLERIVEGLFLGPSHYSIGLQSSNRNEASSTRCDGRFAARTQGAFVAGGYGRDRGRRSGPSSAARRLKRHFGSSSQCADLVVACTAAAERGIADARRWFGQLEPRFAHHPATGELDGVGLKRFPEAKQREHGRHRLF